MNDSGMRRPLSNPFDNLAAIPYFSNQFSSCFHIFSSFFSTSPIILLSFITTKVTFSTCCILGHCTYSPTNIFMENVEVPQYFTCPISLQIMKDPVTATTGITYDRESIETWLRNGKRNPTCPVTKKPLTRYSDLTPNHNLRRLIQSWCTENASFGVDRIPTPKPPLSKFHVLKLLKNLHLPHLQLETLRNLESLASEDERNLLCMAEAGVVEAVFAFMLSCYRNDQVLGLEESLSIIRLVRIRNAQMKIIVSENCQVFELFTWVLGLEEIDHSEAVKTNTVIVARKIIEKSSKSILQELKYEFFEKIVGILKDRMQSQRTNAALRVLLEACPWGRNRKLMIEAGAVFVLIELELSTPEKRTTELILGVLFHLCSFAEGREHLLSHAGAIAAISGRILRVSATADDRAILIFSLICKCSGNNMVLQEMLKVGAVSKLCMVLQSDCASYLKEEIRDILRTHFDAWKDSPCIDVSALTKFSQ